MRFIRINIARFCIFVQLLHGLLTVSAFPNLITTYLVLQNMTIFSLIACNFYLDEVSMLSGLGWLTLTSYQESS